MAALSVVSAHKDRLKRTLRGLGLDTAGEVGGGGRLARCLCLSPSPTLAFSLGEVATNMFMVRGILFIWTADRCVSTQSPLTSKSLLHWAGSSQLSPQVGFDVWDSLWVSAGSTFSYSLVTMVQLGSLSSLSDISLG